jgi:hypothetical protein
LWQLQTDSASAIPSHLHILSLENMALKPRQPKSTALAESKTEPSSRSGYIFAESIVRSGRTPDFALNIH